MEKNKLVELKTSISNAAEKVMDEITPARPPIMF